MLDKTYITVKEAAEIIGCSAGNVRHLIIDEHLKATKVGTYWIIERKQAEDLAKKPFKMGRPRKSQK